MGRRIFIKRRIVDKLIIIGGSAGSFRIVRDILVSLPASYRVPLILCLHRLRDARKGFLEALELKTEFPLREPRDKERIRPGNAYLAPANYHLQIEYGYYFSLSVDEPVNHSRPSIDIVMDTAAEVFKNKAQGVLLSGANMDGSAGMKKIHDMGGYTVVQDPETAEIPTMPESALKLFIPDLLTHPAGIVSFIKTLKA